MALPQVQLSTRSDDRRMPCLLGCTKRHITNPPQSMIPHNVKAIHGEKGATK
jgi:hypothetical protein